MKHYFLVTAQGVTPYGDIETVDNWHSFRLKDLRAYDIQHIKNKFLEENFWTSCVILNITYLGEMTDIYFNSEGYV